ncbi:MAG: 6-bladed beta-propeller [Gemmatimonadales bacterium]|nr:6-bladed beta-propeller [Gemmatimonadales bacterium]
MFFPTHLRPLFPLGSFLVGASLFCIVLSSQFGTGAVAADELLVDGVVHVRNGETPSEGISTIELQEMWRVGDEDDEHIFGVISDVLADDDGNLYLLDMQLSQVSVYSPDGEFLRTISRRGEGPGEVRESQVMIILPNGNLGLVQTFPGKIIMMGLDGIPAGGFSPGMSDPTQGGFNSLNDIQHRSGRLVLCGTSMSMRPEGVQRTHYLASCQEDGKELVRYLEEADGADLLNGNWVEEDQYYVARGRWALGPDGSVFNASKRNNYTIDVYSHGGDLERVIEREYAPYNRTEEDKERFSQRTRIVIHGREVTKEVSSTDPCLLHLEVRNDGDLWVLHSRSTHKQPEGIFQTWDVFSPEGHFVRQVAVVCAGNPRTDRLVFLDDERAVLLEGFQVAALAMAGGVSEVEEDEGVAIAVAMYRVIR